MSAVEFFVSLASVLLGLSLAEVLAGLARTWEARRRIAAGALLPLLGVFLIVDVALFWSWIWFVRDNVEVTAGSLVIGAGVTSVYYMAAYMAFPRRMRPGADLNQHFLEQRRAVLGAVLLANAVSLVVIVPISPEPWGLRDMAFEILYFALVVGAMFARPRWAAFCLVAALASVLLYIVTVELSGPFASAGGPADAEQQKPAPAPAWLSIWIDFMAAAATAAAAIIALRVPFVLAKKQQQALDRERQTNRHIKAEEIIFAISQVRDIWDEVVAAVRQSGGAGEIDGRIDLGERADRAAETIHLLLAHDPVSDGLVRAGIDGQRVGRALHDLLIMTGGNDASSRLSADMLVPLEVRAARLPPQLDTLKKHWKVELPTRR